MHNKTTTSSAISPEERQSAIYAYAAGGFSLFACGTHKDAKAPQQDGWKATPYDPMIEATALPEMYGVPLKDDDALLDVDPRNFKNGINELTQLCAKLSMDKLETFVVSTGGGGVHVYFKKPKDVEILPRVPGFPAIEVKTTGSFVIGAGSIHTVAECLVGEDCKTCREHKGRGYSAKRNSPTDISDIPPGLLALIARTASNFSDDQVGVLDDSEATRGRFIRYCMSTAPAVQGDGGDRTTFKVACEGREYGLSQEVAFEIMRDYFNPRCSPEWSEVRLREKVGNAYTYATGTAGALNPNADFSILAEEIADKIKSEEIAAVKWDVHKSGAEAGQYKSSLINVVNFFRLAPHQSYVNPIYKMLRYNMFADQVEFTKPAPWHDPRYPKQFWADEDAVQLKDWLHEFKNLAVSVTTCHEAAVVCSRKQQYHPVRDWLETLRWDGVPRLDNMLIRYFGSPPSNYVKAVGTCVMLAAIARVFQPGIQHDHMLVLEGKQGTGKSSAVRILGGEFYADIQIDPHQKDTVAGMQGAWFLEASEMEFTRRADVAALKAFLTRTSDKVRLAYARVPVTLPRQCVFIGTVNPGTVGYLQDTTGNRRFWPVKTTIIRREELARDRDQLFAEALVRYRKGEKHFLTDEETINAANAEAMERVAVDSWEEIIHNWVNGDQDELPNPLTTDVVAGWALNLSAAKIGRQERIRICAAMESGGYYSTKIWDKSSRLQVRAWVKDPLHGL